MGLVVLLAVYVGLGVAFVQALPASGIALGVPAEDSVPALDSPLFIQTTGWGTTIEEVRLVEVALDSEGRVADRRAVPVRYEAVAHGRLPGETQGVLVRPDGGPVLAYDARYELSVRGVGREVTWSGVRSVPLAVEATFATALRPLPQLADAAMVTIGQPLAIPWNVPIAEFHYTIRPETPTTSWLSEDGTVAYIALEDYAQGRRHEIEITDARAVAGAPLLRPVSGVLTTPAVLRVVAFSPENGAREVSAGLDPILTFSAPVANPDLADESIVVEPATPGVFRWLAPDRVQFVTDKGFPYSTDISLTLEAGPDGLRSVDGGYVEQPARLAYRTRKHKRIDVDLSRQVVTLFEDGRAVFSTTASTGVRGAETPVGNWTIQYKMEKTRMRGVNPSGLRYDIPDVPWVMVLFGDYAMHGAPWRQAWGTPQSNGCVSMPTPAAKFVYDWTPNGTPVTVHY